MPPGVRDPTQTNDAGNSQSMYAKPPVTKSEAFHNRIAHTAMHKEEANAPRSGSSAGSPTMSPTIKWRSRKTQGGWAGPRMGCG